MTKIKVLKNKKGFTLIELIVVMAILAVLAAIAIPKFSAMRIASTVNADASTAAQIANACRVQETQTGATVLTLNQTAPILATDLQATYMSVPAATQTGGTFTLVSGGGAAPYVIRFTPSSNFAPYTSEQTVTEHVKFVIDDTP